MWLVQDFTSCQLRVLCQSVEMLSTQTIKIIMKCHCTLMNTFLDCMFDCNVEVNYDETIHVGCQKG